jgi:hypothetical protein
MSNLVAGVLPLALGAAVSPTVLAVNLVILGSPVKGRSRGAWFALGGFAVIAALTVVAFAGLLPSAASTGGPDTTAAVLDLGCALLLVALGVRALVRTPSDKPSRAGRRAVVRLPRGGLRRSWPRTSRRSSCTSRQ